MSIRADGIDGIAATTRDGLHFSIVRRAQASRTRETLRTDVVKVLCELHPEGPRKPALAAVALAPEEVLWRAVEVPPITGREQSDFLALWIDRHWPVGRFGRMRWRFHAEKQHAAVLLAHEELIAAIEQGAAEAGVRMVQCVPEVLCLARLVGESDFTLVECGEDAVASTVFSAGKFTRRRWAPASGASLLLPQWRGRESPVRLYGKHSDAVANLAGVPAENGYWAERARETLTGSDAEGASSAALAGLLRLSAAADASAELSLTTPESAWRRKAGLVAKMATWRAAALLAVVAIALLVGGHLLRGHLYESSLEKARGMSFDTIAAQNNIDTLQMLDSEQMDLLAILDGLRDVKPQGAEINSFGIDRKGNVSLTGVTSNFAAVESFTKALGESRWFRDAVTQSNEIVGDNQVKFSIRARLRKRK